jgi:hypothetical protein
LKKQILSIVATLTLVIPMAIIGFAGLRAKVSADVPFDFIIGDKEFKAGKYSIGRVNSIGASETLILRAEDNREAFNFNTNNVIGKGEPRAKLVFHRYGNQYFLAQVFDGQSEQGSGLLKSKAEREAAKKRDVITQNAVEPEVVAVVGQIQR